MASKKKSKTRSAAKSAKKVRRLTAKPKISGKSARKTPARKRVASRPGARRRTKAPSVSAETELKREFQNRNLAVGGKTRTRQSEDFEGVSRTEQADAQSVDELVEEGNVFEAEAVTGIQEADEADEREVHTHELPEDDVPEEYLDKD
jgi:hypothetical protein